MIAPWLVYCVGLSALFGIAALGLEYVARAGKGSARWIWLIAILATVIVPVAINVFARSTPNRQLAISVLSRFDPALPRGTGMYGVSLDAQLLALWFVASLTISARLVTTVVSLRRCRIDWEEVELEGEAVLLSREVGPAVIGLSNRRTVMPRWTLGLDAASRALILQHEREHSREGDPLLLACAAVALIVMPWNPVLWFLVRRLRLAIEMDCDARVLASGANPRVYASLLLTVGERMSHAPFAWAIALAAPPSLLERRIVAITSPFRPRYPRIAITAIGAGVTVALAVACGTGHPDPVTLSSGSRTGLSPQVAAGFKSGAFAKGGDTVVVELNHIDGPRASGEVHTLSKASRMQYLYGRPPIKVRYPDGYEAVVDSLHSYDTLLADHSHDHTAGKPRPR